MKALLKGLIALAMGLTACKRSAVVEPLKMSPGRYSAYTAFDSISNPLNQYDSVGYLHNRLLEGSEGCISRSAKELSSIDGCVIRYAGQLKLDTNTVNLNRQQWFFNDSMNWYRNVLAGLPYDRPVILRGQQLIEIIRSMTAMPTISYSEMRQRIVDFEDLLPNDQDLSSEGRKMLLGAASIARYSAAYWINKYPGQPGDPDAHILGWGLGIAADVSSFLMFPHIGFAAECSAAMSFVGENFM